MPKDRYGESLEVNERVALTRGGTGRVKMSMHKCIITRVGKQTIWCYDYGPTSDGRELRCSTPETRAIKIEHFGYGPDLVSIMSELIALGELSWADDEVDKRHMELTGLLVKGQMLLEEINKEEE